MNPGRISLCMITRDEAENLERCLSAAAPWVDEICVVDTGSRDDTVAIARRHGAVVREIDWPESFAEARNASLDLAQGEWILVLDADEVLRPGAGEILRAVTRDPNAVGGHVRLVNHYDDGRALECLILRLFRNDPNHRFENAIHEQVMPTLLRTIARRGGVIVETGAIVDHYGYLESARRAHDKDERNRRLFERAIRERPGDPYLWFKYADFLRRFDDDAAMLRAFEKTCAIIESTGDEQVAELAFCAEAYALLALELLKRGRFEEAERRLAQARRHPPTAMTHWVSGHLFLRLERWREALESFTACRALDGVPQHMPAQPGITGSRSDFGIARALLGLGETDRACAMFVAGADRDPACRDLVIAAARVELNTKDFRRAVRRLTDWLAGHPDDAEAWALGARLLADAGLPERAAPWRERARRLAVDPEVATIVDDLLGAPASSG